MLNDTERARRETYKKIERQVRREENQRRKALSKAYAELSSTDEDGNRLLDMCSYCGAIHKIRHKHHTGMCVDCGKLYDRWHKAKRLGIESELRLLKPVLLQRLEKARCVDKWAAQQSENFYNSVKNTEVGTMTEVTSKQCKQCGRELSINRFRKYPARGRGVYQTSQGYYTICKDCESISSRAAALLKKEKERCTADDLKNLGLLKEHYRMLEAKGLPPVTAAAKRVLYGEDVEVVSKQGSFEDLLAAVSGASESALDKHCRLVRCRGYASFDEADKVHKELLAELRQDSRFEEINDLMDEWYMEG